MDFYYVLVEDGSQLGPFELHTIAEMLDSGQINTSAKVWTEGLPEWRPITDFFSEPIQARSISQPPPIPRTIEPPTTAFNSMNTTTITKQQGNIILVLLSIGLGFALLAFLKPVTKWEYQILETVADGPSSSSEGGLEKFGYRTIKPPKAELERLGNEGWELVTSFLEIETAHPNFGKDDFVTGLQPNVRPQSAMFLFKRPKRF